MEEIQNGTTNFDYKTNWIDFLVWNNWIDVSPLPIIFKIPDSPNIYEKTN